jgi:transposase
MHLLKPEHKKLQQLLRRLEDLKNLLQIEKNHLEVAVTNEIKKSIEFIVKSLNKQIKEIIKLINEIINQHPELQKKQKLLATIPGIGEATMIQILSFIDIDNFNNIKQLVAFLGLNPKHRQSGKSINGYSRISKTGNRNGDHSKLGGHATSFKVFS